MPIVGGPAAHAPEARTEADRKDVHAHAKQRAPRRNGPTHGPKPSRPGRLLPLRFPLARRIFPRIPFHLLYSIDRPNRASLVLAYDSSLPRPTSSRASRRASPSAASTSSIDPSSPRGMRSSTRSITRAIPGNGRRRSRNAATATSSAAFSAHGLRAALLRVPREPDADRETCAAAPSRNPAGAKRSNPALLH